MRVHTMTHILSFLFSLSLTFSGVNADSAQVIYRIVAKFLVQGLGLGAVKVQTVVFAASSPRSSCRKRITS